MPISAFVVPHIAAPLNNTVRTTLSNMPHLKGLPLAHPVSSAENFEISLLVGVDFHWYFIGDHVVRGDGPTAVSSRLGYTLSVANTSTSISKLCIKLPQCSHEP